MRCNSSEISLGDATRPQPQRMWVAALSLPHGWGAGREEPTPELFFSALVFASASELDDVHYEDNVKQ